MCSWKTKRKKIKETNQQPHLYSHLKRSSKHNLKHNMKQICSKGIKRKKREIREISQQLPTLNNLINLSNTMIITAAKVIGNTTTSINVVINTRINTETITNRKNPAPKILGSGGLLRTTGNIVIGMQLVHRVI
jgi:hypothetical protein